MSLHRLSAGAGYQYLLRHTACGDVERDPSTPLTAYYTDDGYPPGRWLGTGLAGFGDGTGIAAGTAVSEEAMSAVFGHGRDPVSGAPLGNAYPTYRTLAQRIADRSAALPADLDEPVRAQLLARIEATETARRTPGAVAGFDLTFTAPKSASVLWALADPRTQTRIVTAHRAAVDEALAFLEDRALFTRVGARSCAQVPTRGMVAAAFDHWDTRTGDPNLHTHVVIANRVQGLDGRWRSVDSRALHHAVVAVSEIYDDLIADHLARELPVAWSWRSRGPRRTPAFEVDGVEDPLLAEFSTRSADIDTALQGAVVDFHAAHGRGPNRVEILQLRQHVTRTTRPAKTARPLTELLRTWRDRAARLTGHSPDAITRSVLGAYSGARGRRGLRSTDVPDADLAHLSTQALAALMARRSTWTRWNLLAETARTTRSLRMASPEDRHALHDRIVAAALGSCLALDPPELFTVPEQYRRPDGGSVFTRPGEDAFTHPLVLDAELRLLDAADDTTGPTSSEATAHRIATTPQPTRHGTPPVRLAQDQVDAIVTVATSGRRLEVLVGPAGTGKTTTLRALRAAWETSNGSGSVIGLAPSSTAAHELGAALSISCENTAKWLHETVGAGAQQRRAILDGLTAHRDAALARGDRATVHRVDAATQALRREQSTWTLRPRQLLIVDEASLAGTFTLDTLTAQAREAGAKVLLVGDHRQLSAVDAGGAFALLAERAASLELRSLWRFRHRWEADASRLLRHGNPRVLDTYDDRGRITSGPTETMLEDAYRGWQDSVRDDATAILVAADSASVSALNTRAREDRVNAAIVEPTGVPAADGVTVGVGDHVVTRRNDRSLTVSDAGHVRNGALWSVIATQSDGSLTLRRLQPGSAGSGDLAPDQRPEHAASQVTVPASYVRGHVELAYATTIHRAQGITVDHAHVLAVPGMRREALYVAMTRGRASNHLYVATDTVDSDDTACHQDHPHDPGSDARAILETILATAGNEMSATQTLRDRYDAARSVATLDPIRDTVYAALESRRDIADVTTGANAQPDSSTTSGQVARQASDPVGPDASDAAAPLQATLDELDALIRARLEQRPVAVTTRTTPHSPRRTERALTR